MLIERTNQSLKQFNTFGIDVMANTMYDADSVDELKKAIVKTKERGLKSLILGGGSNMLFTNDFDGAVIRPKINEIKVIDENNNSVSLWAGAGVEWDNLVEQTVRMGLSGLENLSLIPGNVGASPIQNIGAYGVEVKDCIEQVQGLYTDSLESFSFSNNECHFGYRDSIFKKSLKGKVVVTGVVFKLSKLHNLITHYGNLEVELERLGGRSLPNVRQAVINIRNSKLPNPVELGNAGSFFKNPVVELGLVEQIRSRFDKVPSFPVNENSVKIPAGWLIEQSGWKGKRVGNVGVHKDQALVLVNYGGASGSELIQLAHSIMYDVMEKFNVELEMEVNVV